MTIEQDLERALRRERGPADLADRVLARIDRRPDVATTRSGWRGTMMPLVAAAAAVVLAVAGAAEYYAYRQTANEAERVKEEIRVALQITSATIADVQRRVESSLQTGQR